MSEAKQSRSHSFDGCPSPPEWMDYAAGLPTERKAEDLLLHAARCENCAEELQRALQILEPPEALEMPAPARGRRWSWTQKVAALAALLAMVWGGWWSYQIMQRPPFGKLMAAYQSKRLVTARIQGAPYGTFSMDRSAKLPPLPADQLEAEALIARRIGSHREDPDWNHALALASLLARRVPEALEQFATAEDLGAASADFFAHYAAAHYENGLTTAKPLEFSRAIELASRSLQVDPSKAAAWHIRGAAELQLTLLEAAERDLRKARELEKDREWQAEIEELLQRIRSKQGSLRKPGAQPGSGTEERLDAALQAGSFENSEWIEAFQKLHRDSWPEELRDAARLYPDAAQKLAAISRVRATTRLDQYSTVDEAFAKLRSNALPRALDAWFRFEELYRASHSGRLRECPDGEGLGRGALRAGYRWLAAQIWLEWATCLGGQGDLNGQAQFIERAVLESREAGFLVLGMRAKGFYAAHLVNRGHYAEAAQLCELAIRAFESESLPTLRLHEFYSVTLRVMERLERWNTAAAAAESAASVAQLAKLKSHETIALLRAGEYFLRAARRSEAEERYGLALAKASVLGNSAEWGLYRARSEFGLAAARGDLAGMTQHSQLEGSSSNFFQTRYWVEMGKQLLREGRPLEALTMSRRVLQQSGKLNTFRADREAMRLVATEAYLQLGRGDAARDVWMGDDRKLPDNLAVLARLQDKVSLWDEKRPEGRWTGESLKLEKRLRRLRRMASMTESDVAVIAAEAASIRRELDLDQKVDGDAQVRYLALNDEWTAYPWSLVLNQESIVVPRVSARPLAQEAEAKELIVFRGGTGGAELDLRLPPIQEDLSSIEYRAGMAIRLDGSGTASAWESALASGQAVHFAGHAIAWKNAPALVLREEADSKDVQRRVGLWQPGNGLLVNAPLVFLAACATGAYRESHHSVPGQLSQSLLEAGAKWVVATLWDVDDGAASLFSKTFYAEYAQSRSIPRSMKMARQRLRESPAYRHPRHWAAFALYHNGSRKQGNGK